MITKFPKKHFITKILSFILILFSALSLKAQTIPAGENISLDLQLVNVNQSTVTSGIIYERVLQIANLYNFNKSTTFNTANYPYFKQALHEMHKASNGAKFVSVDVFKGIVGAHTQRILSC